MTEAKHWQKALVGPQDTVQRVLEVLNGSELQIALVVDPDRKLLGTITDGDVRRGTLQGVSAHDQAERLMNPKPMTATRRQLEENKFLKTGSLHYRHLPILDAEGRVIDLQILEDLLKPSDRKNPVVLMAGGLGARMGTLTESIPKPLLKVGTRPILEIILTRFIHYGFKKFYISVNYKAEMIKQYFRDGSHWGAQVEYIDEREKMGTAGALGLLPQRPELPFFVMNGDLLTNLNFQHLLQFHEEQKTSLTVGLREYDIQVPYGVLKIERQRVTGIDEKPVQKFFVNAGIYVFDPKALDSVSRNEPLDMPALIQRLIEHGSEPSAFPIREYWLDIGHHTDFERANIEFTEIFK